MSKATTTEVPIFPLRTVLLPGGILPLRIFEPRYIDMVSYCMKHSQGFGICAIRDEEKNSENLEQAPTDIYDVGTYVKIIDFESLSGEMLGITVLGEEKFRLTKVWQQDDLLNIGEIKFLPDEKKELISDEDIFLAELLQRIMPDVAEFYGKEHFGFLKMDLNDAAWVGSRLVEFLPINLPVKQMLLECDDPLERLALLRNAVREMQD